MFSFLSWLVQSVLIFFCVAFYTLFERKIIGSFHLRLGPNKTLLFGLFQPLLDAFKLLTKQLMVPNSSNKTIYTLSPILGLVLSLFLWTTIPLVYHFIRTVYSFILFFCLGSVIVFCVLLAGWSSNSKYSLIGSLRSVAQSISYESVFSTLIVLILNLIISFSIISFSTISSWIFLFLFPCWFICVLAEAHRPPFDFSESESELVSGFNTEYSGADFAFTFLSEYSVLLYSCVLIVVIFVPSIFIRRVFFIIFIRLLISYFFVWVRITFCRFRYDLLIILAWKTLLPFSLIVFIISLFFLYL